MLNRSTTLVFASLVFVVTTAVRAEDKAPDAEKPGKEELSAAIDKGIEMLEAEKGTEFLERYMMPDDMAKLKKSGHWEEIVAEFKKAHTAGLLKVLKAIKGAKPEMSDDGETATFDVKKLEGEHPEKIQFRKLKDVWYIADH